MNPRIADQLPDRGEQRVREVQSSAILAMHEVVFSRAIWRAVAVVGWFAALVLGLEVWSLTP